MSDSSFLFMITSGVRLTNVFLPLRVSSVIKQHAIRDRQTCLTVVGEDRGSGEVTRLPGKNYGFSWATATFYLQPETLQLRTGNPGLPTLAEVEHQDS